MSFKLSRLPHGTNRNRTLRRTADVHDEEVDLAELERLFRRFWRSWHKPQENKTGEVGT